MAEIYRDSIGKGVTFSIPSTAATVTGAKIHRGGVETVVQTAIVGSETKAEVPYSITRYDGKFDIEFTYTVTGSSNDLAVTYKEIVNGTAKLTTSYRHEVRLGDSIVVSGVGAPFNGTFLVSAVTSNTVSYSVVGADVSHVASSGTITAPFVKRETHEVVTPLFTVTDLRTVDPDFQTISDLQIQELEGLIRSLFETHTGQKFGLEYGMKSFLGNGNSSMNLPVRSAEPYGPTFGDGPARAVVTNNGWVIEGYSTDSWILRFEPELYDTPLNNFANGKRFYLEGLWGYYSVPDDIARAAMLLAQDYGCDQSLWRERYLKSIRMADMRFEFDGRAFSRTGNVNVDQILDRYARVRAGIL